MSENEEYDFEGANGGSSPRCPQGTYEITVQRVELYNTTRDDLPPAKLFSITFTVDAVLAGGVPADDEFDKNPLTAVIPGDVRGLRLAIDKTKKINEKHRAEVCAFVQAACGLVPGSAAAKTATDGEGKPVSWNTEIIDSADVNNPLEGSRLRMTLSRTVSKNKNAYYVPTFAPIKSPE